LNLYTYCWNNPIIYVDSTGNKPRVFKQANQAYKASGAEEMTKTFLDAFSTPDTQTMTIEFTNKNGELQSISYEGLSNEAIISMATGPSSKIAKGAKAAVIAGQEVKAAQAANNVLKYSLKTLNNNAANKLAKDFGYINAEAFKESFVGKKAISKFNIKYDSKTGEIVLESVQKGGAQIPTGLYKE